MEPSPGNGPAVSSGMTTQAAAVAASVAAAVAGRGGVAAGRATPAAPHAARPTPSDAEADALEHAPAADERLDVEREALVPGGLGRVGQDAALVGGRGIGSWRGSRARGRRSASGHGSGSQRGGRAAIIVGQRGNSLRTVGASLTDRWHPTVGQAAAPGGRPPERGECPSPLRACHMGRCGDLADGERLTVAGCGCVRDAHRTAAGHVARVDVAGTGRNRTKPGRWARASEAAEGRRRQGMRLNQKAARPAPARTSTRAPAANSWVTSCSSFVKPTLEPMPS